ncbi:Secreted effector protein pipB2 [Vibrio campbellii]|uniref:pentapeptide repeat-containing protein n=1 Tax=Vibrio campbellii TaxID=680 RepID=UPI00097FB925|nr:pentapeptide repeat-containing protein [Vibrio campbellii]AQM66593.1 Secreted effector protein pipB2 [Vibrio campbellii]
MSSFLGLVVEHHEEIRSIAQAAGATIALIIAPIGLWLTWRRTKALGIQNELTANAQRYQADSDEKKRLYESYQLGVQELAHEHEFRRLGAVVILGDVARDVQFTKPAFTAISGLVRSYSNTLDHAKTKHSDEAEFKKYQRLDVVAAIEQIKKRKIDVPHHQLYDFSINLQFAYIPYSELATADLRFSSMDHANLMGSNCVLAKFDRASMENADLTKVNFRKASFKMVNLKGSNLSESNLTKTSLIAADITGADFRGCKFSKLMVVKSRDDIEKSEERLKDLNFHLPTPIKFGEFYHPIQTAYWDTNSPPIVDDEIQHLVEEKTKYIIHQNNERV